MTTPVPTHPVVRRSITLDAPAELVWETLTAPDQLREWLGLKIDAPLVPGSAGRHHEDGIDRDVLVVDVVPGSSLLWHWANADGDGSEISTVSITVDRDEETAQTVVTVIECAADHRSGSGVCARVDASSDTSSDVWDGRLTGLRSVVARRSYAGV